MWVTLSAKRYIRLGRRPDSLLYKTYSFGIQKSLQACSGAPVIIFFERSVTKYFKTTQTNISLRRKCNPHLMLEILQNQYEKWWIFTRSYSTSIASNMLIQRVLSSQRPPKPLRHLLETFAETLKKSVKIRFFAFFAHFLRFFHKKNPFQRKYQKNWNLLTFKVQYLSENMSNHHNSFCSTFLQPKCTSK